MSDEMDAMMADGLLHTVRQCARLLYGENKIYPCDDVKRMAAEIEKLRASLRNMEQHMEENITLTEALRQEQEWVIRLSKALRGVIRVADRNTAEFNEARAALGGKDE